MDKTFKITIKLLTEKVKENLEKIQNNRKDIGNLLTRQESEPRNEKLKKKYSANETLLKENLNLINVQLGLTSLMDKAFSENNESSSIMKDINDCLEHTINVVSGEKTACNYILEDRVLAFS